MKKWRKDAKFHNEVAGYKHQGRRNKLGMFMMKASPSMLVVSLFKRVGLGFAEV